MLATTAFCCGPLLRCRTSVMILACSGTCASCRISLSSSGLSDAAKPGVAYAQDVPLSFTMNMNTWRSRARGGSAHPRSWRWRSAVAALCCHCCHQSDDAVTAACCIRLARTLASVSALSWYAFSTSPFLRLENACRIWSEPCVADSVCRMQPRDAASWPAAGGWRTCMQCVRACARSRAHLPTCGRWCDLRRGLALCVAAPAISSSLSASSTPWGAAMSSYLAIRAAGHGLRPAGWPLLPARGGNGVQTRC